MSWITYAGQMGVNGLWFRWVNGQWVPMRGASSEQRKANKKKGKKR